MDMETKNDSESEKMNDQEVSMNYQSPNISSEWQLSGSNLTNASIGMVVPSTNQMVDSFCPTTWDQSTNSPNLGFCDVNVQMDLGPFRAGVDRTLGPSWSPSNVMLKGGMFLPPAPMMLPQSLMQFPADSGFIERAARFSCFSGGNFGDIMHPFNISESSMNPYYRGLAPIQGPQEVLASNGLKSPQKLQHLSSVAESSKDVPLTVDRKDTERSPLKNEKKSESITRSQDEAKEVAGVSSNESDEAGFSGRQEEMEGAGEESYGKNIGSKKRKRGGQDTEPNQMKGAQQLPAEIQEGEQNLNSNASKPGGKNGKQAEFSDPTKEEYIHVRARRGQATNSHSLAERIRREKISERMKYLQDLVPGCNKVTGKAVMLDEIINYVQSLQRQVEFLSMKLATVNPRLDFDIDGLLAKDVLQSRAGPSSSLAFPPDMTMPYPPFHPPQARMLQSGLPGYGFPSDAFRRAINPHLATTSCGPGDYKDPSSQALNEWDNELHNVVQMGLNSSVLLSSQRFKRFSTSRTDESRTMNSS